MLSSTTSPKQLVLYVDIPDHKYSLILGFLAYFHTFGVMGAGTPYFFLRELLKKGGGVEDFGSRDIGGGGVGLDKRILGGLKEKGGVK